MDAPLPVPRVDETQRIAVERADRVLCRPLMVSLFMHLLAKYDDDPRVGRARVLAFVDKLDRRIP